MRDALQRPFQALRVSVTDRCNFRCPTCMPREIFGPEHTGTSRADILSFEEILRVVRVAVDLGVTKVRLTGGEPLLRRDLPLLVRGLRAIPGLHTLALTTNGALLPDLALPLREAGVDRLTVSLHSLDPVRFQHLADTTVTLDRVLAGLEAARAAGFGPLKLNCVLQRGLNDGEILDLAAFARREGHILRFIEFMDVGTANGWNRERVVPGSEVASLLERTWGLERHSDGPHCVAQHWRYRDGKGEIGLINSVTEPFCQGCDRGRLSADGHLYTCLFAAHGLDLRPMLQAGDDGLREAMTGAWLARDDRYSELRAEGVPAPRRVEMFKVGG